MKNIKFIKPVFNLSEIPPDRKPTIVLCGRSNVGKSSFINSLFNSSIAKTSSLPGKTRSLNYYSVDDKFYMVDFPGFGYAKVSKSERESWKKLIANYLNLNDNIQYVFHLIDSRHNPTELDIQFHEFIRSKDIAYCAILNKIDKLKQAEIARSKKTIVEYFPDLLFGENLFAYSAISGIGKKDVIKLISALFNS